jgi:hypothetical protein
MMKKMKMKMKKEERQRTIVSICSASSRPKTKIKKFKKNRNSIHEHDDEMKNSPYPMDALGNINTKKERKKEIVVEFSFFGGRERMERWDELPIEVMLAIFEVCIHPSWMISS